MNLIIGPALRAWRKRQLARKYPDGKVSPNFRYREFFTHDGTPIPLRALPGLERLCKVVLEPMRAKFGPCHVLSGYRHYTYNRDVVHGASDSRHVWDRHPDSPAADLTFAEGNPEEWGDYARLLMLRADPRAFGGVGRYRRMRFVHVDLRGYRADWRGSGE